METILNRGLLLHNNCQLQRSKLRCKTILYCPFRNKIKNAAENQQRIL